ncbi:MAG: glycoside hydrolase family 3 C-terminal domain-containing protein [Saccharofermentans sp.]|nr:glycoside hydrolase family 3 C-terminal domain-containing protein [Saccharofermentans sp.]
MHKNLRKALATTLAASVVMSMAACSTKEVDKDEEVETTVEETSAEETDATTKTTEATETEAPVVEADPVDALYERYGGMTPEEIVATMSLEDKASQMVEGALYDLGITEMSDNCYGSVLSTNGNWPATDYSHWSTIVTGYQTAALTSDAGIPFVYGQDSVHGLNTVFGSQIFPHNINIGAANDIELTREYGVVVGSDLLYTKMLFNFSPCVAAAQDPRWGRTYESYSSEPSIIQPLAVAYTEGLLSQGIIVCPKHFICEGYVMYGTGEGDMLIDRGDAIVSDDIIDQNLAIYQALVDSGAQTIMISHSALNGIKMHENTNYVMIIKEEMGFEGFIISDWDSLENCSGADLYENTVLCVNAGVDILMEERHYDECRDIIIEAVNNGDISMDRIDDAVTRIIRVKMEAGLFDDPYLDNLEPAYDFNSDYEIELARTLAEESLVPLKDDMGLSIKPGSRVFVAGPAATDMGAMCGGWTVTWQGQSDQDVDAEWINGYTILEALERKADDYDITIVTDEAEIDTCDMVLLCVGEIPYAEWYGDTEDLSITGALALQGNEEAIALAADSGLPTFTLIIAGRNVIISDYIDQWDSVIMCYLPGSQGGNAIANALMGEVEYRGTLPMPYYESVDDIDYGDVWLPVGFTCARQD